MKFKIQGTYPVLRVFLNTNESIITSSGSMSWMTDKFNLTTKTNGGVAKGFFRALSGETMFQNIYTSTEENQEIAFASSLPGVIKHIQMEGRTKVITQKTAFLASTPNVMFETIFTQKISSGLLGGEGFILQRFSGTGDLFLEADGDLVEFFLKEGEVMLVDQGNVFMFDETISYGLKTVKGLKNKIFGGEGVFLVELKGTGRVILQTLPINKLSSVLSPYITSPV